MNKSEIAEVETKLIHIAAAIIRREYLPSLERCRTIADARAEIARFDDKHISLSLKVKEVVDELRERAIAESQPPTKYDRNEVRKLEQEIALEPGNKFVGWKLGDGEPSPPPVEQCKNCGLQIGKQSWGQFGGVWIHVITQRPKCPTAGNASRRTDCVAEPLRSGAAQEVSPPSPDTAHIWDSITRVAESRHDYGVCTLTRSACQKLIGEKLHGGDTRELKAAIEQAARIVEQYPTLVSSLVAAKIRKLG